MRALRIIVFIPVFLFFVNILMPTIGFSSAPKISYFGSQFRNASVQEFEDYIKSVSNINAVDNNGKTLLHIAFEKKYPLKIIIALLNAGADIHMRDTDGETPLFYACKNQDETGVAAGVHTSGSDTLFSVLPLETSEAINSLTDSFTKGANINSVDANGKTLLHHVCKENYDFELFLFLLNKGAAVNIIDKDGKTPLQYAYENQQIDCFENPNDVKKIPLHIRNDIMLCKKYTKSVYSLKNFAPSQDVRYVFFKTGILGATNQIAAIITYVKKEDGTSSVFVAFRGSRTLNDVTVDSVAFQLTVDADNGHIFPEKLHGSDNFVYYGFLWRYKALSNEIRYHIRDLLITKNCSLDTTKFYFTGHSLGGALANICALDIQNHFQIKRSNTHLVSFSAPRVFSKNMAKEVSKYISPASYRFFMMGDPVATMPPESMGWSHVGTLIQIRQSVVNVGSTAAPNNVRDSFQKIAHRTSRHVHYIHSMDRFDASLKKAFSE